MIRQTVCLFSMALAALAQIPGQYPPGLPGQYPPGSRIPGQTGPNGRQPNGGQQPNNRPRSGSNAKNPSLTATTVGILRRVSPNQLVIEAADHRVIWYQLSGQLMVRKSGKDAELSSFGRGDTVSVDSNEDDQGILTATSVSWQKAATPEDLAATDKDWDLPKPPPAGRASTSASSPVRDPGDDRPVLRRKDPAPDVQPAAQAQPDAAPQPEAAPKQDPPKQVAAAQAPAGEPENDRPTTVMRPPDAKPDPDDPGPPSLRRGVPPSKRASNPDSSSSSPAIVASAAPAKPAPAPSAPAQPPAPVQSATPVQPPAPVQPAVALPQDDSVISKAREAAAAYSDTLPNFFVQQMTTRYQIEGRQEPHALDIVTADVAYENGQETYKNVKVGSKAAKSMDDIEGARSTGEFATILEALLEDPGAIFRRKGQDTIRNRSAWIYTFEVPRELSRWRVESPSQLYYPGIRGSVWIDRETSRVLRIEQQGRDIPKLFPFDTVETTTDYDFVRLGASEPFLLPVEAEVLTCIRGTIVCSSNKIEFRNYRKFASDTNIIFDTAK